MGFRNRLTSAAVVDTRVVPAGAGVRVYQDNSDPSRPRGMVEFSDGFGGDLPGYLTQHAEANTHAGNASLGGGITVVGGEYNGAFAPNLDLKVADPYGDGTRATFATINQPLYPALDPTGVNVAVANLSAGVGGWPTLDYLPLRLYLLPIGFVMALGLVRIANVASLVAGPNSTVRLCTWPSSGYAPPAPPSGTAWPMIPANVNDTARGAEPHADGLYLRTGGYTLAAGNFVSVSGMWPAANHL